MWSDVIVGTAVGIGSGLTTWWITARAITPKICISSAISKLPDDAGTAPWRYRVKVINVRRPWLPDAPAVEIDISATLRIKGLRPIAPETWVGLPIPIGSTGEIAFLRRDRSVRLRLYDLDWHARELLPVEMRRSVRSREITLEELFTLGSEVRLQVVLSASHSYTHARSTAIGTYRASDIRCGLFDKHGLDVVEDPSLCEPNEDPKVTSAGRSRLPTADNPS
jgi:hypothetical protein